MPNILRFILCICCFCFFSGSIFSQEKYLIAYEKEGDFAMENGEYETALGYYNTARKFFQTPLRLYYKMGEACRLTMDYDKAEFFYQKVITENDSINLSVEFPSFYKNFVEVAISNGNLFSSQDLLKKLLVGSNDSILKNYATSKLKTIDWVIKNNNPIYGTYVMNLGRNVNNESSQTGNCVLGDSLLFISNIEYTKFEKNGITYYQDAFQQIFTSMIDSNGYSPLQYFNIKEINKKNRNISNICFDQSTNTAYFTRCNSYNNEICYIYYSIFENGKYQKAKKLNKKINLKNYSNTQPNIASNNIEKILYFSSNRNGGYGGYDLYYYVLDGKDNEAINLGPTINTPGDEITPYFSKKDNSLYFSSNNHIGFGGFDIYKAEGWATRWLEPENLMQPINSPANEVYPIILQSDDKGYFTSNREGSFSTKNKTCCNDIYMFESYRLPEVSTMDKIKNKSDFSPIFDLPLQLFFHNDQPNPQSNLSKTNFDYEQCYKEYKSLINTYKAEATRYINDTTENQIIDSIDRFFSLHIDKGMDKLNSMCNYLLTKLENGEKINISIIGYSSALHNEMYNFNLSERRIGSIINYITKWKDGSLDKYIKLIDKDNLPHLNIKTLSMGKIESKSENPKNIIERRKSIYKIDAMYERRIEIRLIEIRK